MSQVWSIPIQNKDIQHHLNMFEASDFDQWDGFDMFWPSFAWVGLQLCQVVGVQVAGIKTHGPKIKFGDSWLHIMNHDGFFLPIQQVLYRMGPPVISWFINLYNPH